MHYFRKCDADMRVPPSKINSKERVEEGDDHLSFLGRSADVCCLIASIDDIMLVWFECKRRSRTCHESEALRDFAQYGQC